MGSVWLADHLALHTQVVVKFMSTELSKNADAVARFAREASAAAQVKSPHVVQMLDHGVTPDNLPYIVMELLEGRELSKYMEERRVLPPEEVAAIVTQMSKALRRAHERRIVHRDIKPDNIFMCDVGGGDLFIKLLDFGIAKSGDGQSLTGGSGTRTGAMIGTPYYMSPEQLVGAKEIDHRSDLWSLAVVAFQALTGSLPFMAETIAGLAVAIHGGAPPLPSKYNPALNPGIDAWFLRACARDPAARFPSATEMASALESAVRGSAQYALTQHDPGASQQARAVVSAAVPVYATPAPTPAPFGVGIAAAPSTPDLLPASTQAGFGTTIQPTEKRAGLIAIAAAGITVGLGLLGAVVFFATRAPVATSVPAATALVSPATSSAPPSLVEPLSLGIVPPPEPIAIAKPAPSASVAAAPPARAVTASARAPVPPPVSSPSPSPRATTPKSAPLPATKDFDHQ
jgi:serine/threonine-protein kinase